jgi:hypothetical protein
MRILFTIASLLLFVSCNKSESDYPVHKLVGITANYSLPGDISITTLRSLPVGFLGITSEGKGLVLLDNEFKVVKHFQNNGFGPGETQKIDRFTAKNNRIVVLDSEKRSFEVFDSNLNYLHSLTPEDRILDLVHIDENTLVGLGFTMNTWYLVKYSGYNYSDKDVIFSQSTRSPEQGVGQLASLNQKVIVNRIFTNQSDVIDINSLTSSTIVNKTLPARPEMISGPIGAIPTGPVFAGGRLFDNTIWQYSKNDENGTMSVFELNFDSQILARYDLDIWPQSLAFRNDTLFTIYEDRIILYQIGNHD